MSKEKKVNIEKKAGGLVHEFKEFIARGNVIDMAVGVIMGAAFTPIVNSLVNDIVMPCIGMLIGDMDFSSYRVILKAADAANDVEEVAIGYGNFIQVILNFLIISLCIFILIKGINKLKRPEEKSEQPAVEPAPDPQIVLLTEIRDLLKEGKIEEAEEKVQETV